MKKLIFILTIVLIAVTALAKDVYVSGYTRSDGTYVAPYHRQSPDNNPYNNYSSKGNYNPYTGEAGTVQPNPYYGGGVQAVGQYGSKSPFGSGNFGN
jgi:hypothetical protein